VCIYDGPSGAVLFSQPHSSCTWHEYPVVADVEGQFRAKLIVPSNMNCSAIVKCPPVDPVFAGLRCQRDGDCPGLRCDAGHCRCQGDPECSRAGDGFVCRLPPPGLPGSGPTCQAAHSGVRAGVRVFADVLDRWVSSRPLWSEHAYAITGIRDDGTIPRTSEVRRNFELPELNSFRMNLQGRASPDAVADLTARPEPPACRPDGVLLLAQVCNRGTAPAGDGVEVSFQKEGRPVCTARTQAALLPGTCAPVRCLWPGAPPGPHTITVTADDAAAVTECFERNNRGTITFSC
jgi:hypothetical protein